MGTETDIRAGAAPSAEHRDSCRSCGSDGLIDVLQLGDQPLANALRRPDELSRPEPRYPLDLSLCTECSLLQILDSVPPEELFEDYPYFSSVVEALVENARVLVGRLSAREGLGAESLAMEIASNDGYLLQHYRDAGVPVLGIEPARNIAPVAEERGIATRCAFFGQELAADLVAEGLSPDVIHANNVLAHVPDLNGFVAGLSMLLEEGGVAVIEVPYVKDFLDRRAFDTIYHEHHCYFSLTALEQLFARHGIAIEEVELIPIHGESLRLFARRSEFTETGTSTARMLGDEEAWEVGSPRPYLAFADAVRRVGELLNELLAGLKADGRTIAAYGAAAKGSTLLNTFGIGGEVLDFVADASPHKQGLHMPGSGLPIRPPQALLEERPDYLLVLAWNLVDEIANQQRDYLDGGGQFIVPIPEPRILTAPARP